MHPRHFTQLFFLAAIWGFSFIFMRILAPALGPVLTADLRVLIGGTGLLVYMYLRGMRLSMAADWKHLAIIGMLNSGLPFVLFSFAALHMPAGYSAILNASVPFFSLILAAMYLGEPLTPRKLMGLLAGFMGVALISGVGMHQGDRMFGIAVLCCLISTFCYALSALYTKLRAAHIASTQIACGSQLASALMLAPFALATLPAQITVTPVVILSLFGIGLMCSSLAFLIFFRLIAEIGPTNSSTVTFIVPMFGMLWGWVFLQEAITPTMIGGCAMVLTGTLLVVRSNNGRQSARSG